ncbi:hypothetical protein ADUPG1_009951 [Aduncisulcus paluster]|uniref:Sphingomyelin synthase-like domain-containing protein n=1 Tax=Aduncisulcus paluster TaxID=2918883 RepID=A0ABQ5KYH2_9EUKA|nr:hypothetical protein ADUPG1_009951 [Aduncisulcus paluster]
MDVLEDFVSIKIPDYLITIYGFSLGLFAFCDGPNGWVRVRSYFIMYNMCFLFRGLFIPLSVLPDVEWQCMQRRDPDDKISSFWSPLMVLFGPETLCGDLLFSGHSCGLIIGLSTIIDFWVQRYKRYKKYTTYKQFNKKKLFAKSASGGNLHSSSQFPMNPLKDKRTSLDYPLSISLSEAEIIENTGQIIPISYDISPDATVRKKKQKNAYSSEDSIDNPDQIQTVLPLSHYESKNMNNELQEVPNLDVPRIVSPSSASLECDNIMVIKEIERPTDQTDQKTKPSVHQASPSIMDKIYDWFSIDLQSMELFLEDNSSSPLTTRGYALSSRRKHPVLSWLLIFPFQLIRLSLQIFLSIALACLAFYTMFTLAQSRLHYSIDIILGISVSSLCCTIYFLKRNKVRRRGASNLFERVVQYCEDS